MSNNHGTKTQGEVEYCPEQVHKKASLLASPVVSLSSLVQGQLTTAWTPAPMWKNERKGQELLATEVHTHTRHRLRRSGSKWRLFSFVFQKALAVSCCVSLEDVEAH